MTVFHPHDRLPAHPTDLVLCSSGTRWRSAVRDSLRRGHSPLARAVLRLCEIEDLQQLGRALEDRERAVVGLEVGEENVRVCLEWLTDRRRPSVPVVGLLTAPPQPIDIDANEKHRERVEILATAVREAGAVWTVSNPLQVDELLQIAARFGRYSAPSAPAASHLSQAIWQTLPWHSNRRPLRLTEET